MQKQAIRTIRFFQPRHNMSTLNCTLQGPRHNYLDPSKCIIDYYNKLLSPNGDGLVPEKPSKKGVLVRLLWEYVQYVLSDVRTMFRSGFIPDALPDDVIALLSSAQPFTAPLAWVELSALYIRLWTKNGTFRGPCRYKICSGLNVRFNRHLGKCTEAAFMTSRVGKGVGVDEMWLKK